MDGTDSTDGCFTDSSGAKARQGGPEEWGCHVCMWRKETEGKRWCDFAAEGPADISDANFCCPRYDSDGAPLPDNQLPLALTEDR